MIAIGQFYIYSFHDGAEFLMTVLMLTSILVMALLAAAVMLFRTMSGGEHSLPVTAEWISDLSTERYRPMMRILDSADIEFLRAQPGYTKSMESKLRTQRCQVFRGYLRCLNSDFQRVCMALKIVMAQSEQDRPDLAAPLLDQQFRFASAMLAIRFRLRLYEYGICTVDATSLVRIFDGMRVELCTLVPNQVAAVA